MVAKWQIKQLLLAGLLGILATQPLTAQQVSPDTAILLSPNFGQVSVDSLFRYIRKNTGFSAVYASSLTHGLHTINYRQQKVPLHKMLDTIFGRLGLGYSFRGVIIRLYRNGQQRIRHDRPDTLQGKVTDQQGKPLGGVSVFDPLMQHYAITSHDGRFKLSWPDGSRHLELSHVSYEKKVLHINNAGTLVHIILKPAFGSMDEVMVTPYYNISGRKSTSAVSRVTGEILERSSAGVNPIRELSGRVPGLIITETSGAPGAVVRVQIRGRQSIGTVPGIDNQPMNDPLMVLDKVPLVTGNKPVTLLPSAAGDPQTAGISAQAAINPADIETIDVLKDADATAIYGSRGAHGAILFTSRSGRQGRPAFRFNLQSGAVVSSHIPKLFDNRQYTAMRKEALAAAGLQADVNNAPDLLLLDTNQYINLPQLLAGGVGGLIQANASLRGGDSLLRYYFSSSYYREGSVMPASLFQQRLTTYGNIRYRSPGSRLQAHVSLHYSLLNYHSIANDPMAFSRLVPLLPALHDSTGRLTSSHNGFPFINPLAQFTNSYTANISSCLASLQVEYRLNSKLRWRSTLGFQSLPVKEALSLPIAGQHPAQMSRGEIATAYSRRQSWIVEPQLMYEHAGDYWEGGGLLGATFQEKRKQWYTFRDIEYQEAAELNAHYMAGDLYRYYSLYSRWHTGWCNRYLLNATGRLDVSSHLGPGRKMALFGALGGAWIFSEETWMRRWQWLTLGKLRASYGTAGNDNIDDYAYPQTWTLQPGKGAPPLNAGQQANPLLGWEKNRKLEVALELEMAHWLRFNVAWYRHSTSDQLITANVRSEAGPVGNYAVNWPAIVLNTGWEFSLQAYRQWRSKNSYSASLVFTLPRNRLLSFPGIENTPYYNILVVGQPLSARRVYRFNGVDTNTGLFRVPGSPETVVAGHLEPRAYGGWLQECRLGRWRISLFLEARWQMALDPLYDAYREVWPGRWSHSQLTNQPRTVWQRWQQPGDQAALQRFTAANTLNVQQAIQFYRNSDAMIVDASFWRIRTLYLSWELPGNWLKKVKVCEGRMYLQGQNLFTGTAYRDGDPTIQYPLKLPSLRTITAGLQIGF